MSTFIVNSKLMIIFVFDSHQKYVPHMERVEPPQGVTIGILYWAFIKYSFMKLDTTEIGTACYNNCQELVSHMPSHAAFTVSGSDILEQSISLLASFICAMKTGHTS